MNKIKEYVKKNNMERISIPYYKKGKNFVRDFYLCSNYRIGTYTFLFTNEQFEKVIGFLDKNKIKNDGGFVFGYGVMIEIYCNKIWIGIVDKFLKAEC